MNCIFCKFVKRKESKREIVYENDSVIAIKPRTETSPGHTLVLPKQHFENIFDIPAEALKEIIVAAQHVAGILKMNHKPTGINLLHASGKDAGQSVFHFHLHLVPRYPDDGLDLWLKEERQQ